MSGRLGPRRVLLGVAVLCSVVATSPAGAQTFVPTWEPDNVEIAESSGVVVLTIVKGGPGPVRYRTEDGACPADGISPPPTGCSSRPARAPGDYTSVSGEVLFTEAGSRQVTIPIVDDSLDEGDVEAFTVWVTEVDERGGWLAGSNAATVRIVDDDGVGGTQAGSATATTAAAGRTSAPVAPIPRPPTTLAAVDFAPPATTSGSPPGDLAAHVASEDLQPGSGSELPGPSRRGGGDSSSSIGFTTVALGIGSLAAVVGAGAAAGTWHRRRGSSTPV